MLSAIIHTIRNLTIPLLGALVIFGSFAVKAEPEIILSVQVDLEGEYNPNHWQALTEYLNFTVTGHRFKAIPQTHAQLVESFRHNNIHLSLLDPVLYLQFKESSSLATVLVTETALFETTDVPVVAGAIIVPQQRSDLQSVADLKGGSIAISTRSSLQAYLAQVDAMKETGVDVSDVQIIEVVDGTEAEVVHAVLDGKVAAGFISAGRLEKMLKRGQLEQGRLKVINGVRYPGLPFEVSTKLFPARPLIALPHVDANLRRKITAALYQLDNGNTLTADLGISHFDPPSDYQVVEELAREMKLPPFDAIPEFTASDVWNKYKAWLLLGALLVALVFVLVIRLAVANKKLTIARRQAEKAALDLSVSEQNYRTLFNGVSETIYVMDGNGVFLDVNDAAERMFGKSKSSIVGNTIEVIGAPDKNDIADILLKTKSALEGIPQQYEFWGIRENGEIFPNEVYLTCGQYYDNKVVFASAVDISEQVNAVRELKLSKERFDLAMAASKDGLWDWDLKTNNVYYNPAWKSMLGYEDHELENVFATWEALVDIEDREETVKLVQECLEGTRSGYEVEFRMKHKDGHWVNILSRCILVRDDEGNPQRFVGTHVDLSFSREMEQRLRESEARANLIIDSTPDVIIVVNSKGIITRSNPALTGIFGYTQDEVVGQKVEILVPEEYKKYHELIRDDYMGKPYPIRARSSGKKTPILMGLHKNGKQFPLEFGLAPVTLNGEQHVIASLKDITAHKAAEQALKDSEAHLTQERDFVNAVLETAGTIIVVLDRTGRFVRFNRAAEAITGFQFEELRGVPVWDTVIPKEIVESVKDVFRDLSERAITGKHENEWLMKDGSKRLFEWHNTVLCDEHGQVSHVISQGIDITEIRHTQKSLAESEARFRAIFEQSSDAVLLVNNGLIVDCNHIAEKMFASARKQLLGKTLLDYSPHYQRGGRPSRVELEDRFAAGQNSAQYFEWQHKRKDGNHFDAEVTVSKLCVDDLFIDQVIVRDISERKRVENELEQYRKHLEDLVVERTKEVESGRRQLEVLIENLPAVFYMRDLDGRHLMINRRYEQMIGVDKELIIGHRAESLLPDRVMEKSRSTDKEALQSGITQTYEETIPHPDGKVHDYLTTKMPLLNEYGKAYALLGVSTDVSEIKNLQRNLSTTMRDLQQRVNIESLVSESASQLIGLPPEMVSAGILTVLKNVADFSGARATFILELSTSKNGSHPGFQLTQRWGRSQSGKSAENFVLSDDAGEVLVRDCLNRKIIQLDHSGGETYSAEISLAFSENAEDVVTLIPIVSKEVVKGVLGLVLDHKSHWKTKDMGLLKTLAILIGETIKSREFQNDLQMAKTEAEQLAEVKSEFLANMSHEIRTPLGGMLGLARIGLRDSRETKQLELFGRIMDSGQHLLNLVNDILDFSKFEAGKLQLDSVKVSVSDLVDKSVSFVSHMAYIKGLDFKVLEHDGIPESIQTDDTRLVQVLANLLGNAIKFTETGEVSLEVACDKRSLKFKVIDSGIGISQEQLINIFNAFEQADGSVTRRFGGTGLGLAISEKIVRAMGGSIAVSSEPGVGSTFVVTIPLEEAVFHKAENKYCDNLQMIGFLKSDEQIIKTQAGFLGGSAHSVSFEQAIRSSAQCLILPIQVFNKKMRSQVEACLDNGKNIVVVTPAGETQSVPRVLKGSTVELERPIRLRQIKQQLEKGGDDTDSTIVAARLDGVRVLAADDVEVNRIVLEDILKEEGATFDMVDNGLKAVERVSDTDKEGFDIVLMDIQMPVMGGYDATRKIKEIKPDLPIVGLTSHAMNEERERCLNSGMSEHVTKPIDVDHLASTILRVLGRDDGSKKAKVIDIAPYKSQQEERDMAKSVAKPAEVNMREGIVDWEALKERFNNRDKFIDKILASVAEKNADIPEQIKNAIDTKDFERLSFLAHSIKGAAGSIMAMQVRDVANKAEISAREKSEDCFQRSQELSDSLESLLSELTTHLSTGM